MNPYEDDNCTRCGQPIRKHRTRGGRWVGCRADDLRARATMPEAVRGFAMALNPAGGALAVAVPFSLTSPVSTATGIQPGFSFDDDFTEGDAERYARQVGDELDAAANEPPIE